MTEYYSMDSAMDNCAHSGILTLSSLIIVRRKEWPKPDKCREIQASKQANKLAEQFGDLIGAALWNSLGFEEPHQPTLTSGP